MALPSEFSEAASKEQATGEGRGGGRVRVPRAGRRAIVVSKDREGRWRGGGPRVLCHVGNIDVGGNFKGGAVATADFEGALLECRENSRAEANSIGATIPAVSRWCELWVGANGSRQVLPGRELGSSIFMAVLSSIFPRKVVLSGQDG